MEKKAFDLITFGEIMLRLSPPRHARIVDGDIFEKRAGGAELNVASGVALMGLRTGIISRLPQNELGTFIKNRIRFVGVSDDFLTYDDDPRARYFAQAKYGVYARMALIMNMLSDPDPKPLNELADPAAHCTNARCITQVEPYLPHLAQQNNRCGFCDHDLVKNQ